MRTATLFIALVGCSGGGSTSPPPQLAWPRSLPDAAPDAAWPRPITRGGACNDRDVCAAGMTCVSSPGGTCASRCGALGAACEDGACVPTMRDGELCLRACTRDAECRIDEGYFCDPAWQACAIPNTLALRPRACPGPSTRDPRFGASAQPSTSAGRDPAAVLASDGAPIVAYAAHGERERLIVTRAGHAEHVLAEALDGAPALARDRRGIVYAAWLASDTILLARSRDDGRTWTAPDVAVAAGECTGVGPCLEPPSLVVGPDPAAKQRDVVYVVYPAAGGVRVRVSYDEGASFRAGATAVPGIRGSAAIASDGRLHVVGLHAGPHTGAYGSANHALYHAASSDAGRTFTRPARVSQRDERLPFYFAVPRVVVDSKRRWLYVAYVRGGRDGVWDLAILASKDGGATWKRTRIGDACALHLAPQLALDPTTGALHVAWYDTRGAPGRRAHATCTPGLATCTPPAAIHDRAFAALSMARGTPSSVGDGGALLVDDKRRTLHAVWAQPVDEAGVTKARIFHAAAKLFASGGQRAASRPGPHLPAR